MLRALLARKGKPVPGIWGGIEPRIWQGANSAVTQLKNIGKRSIKNRYIPVYHCTFRRQNSKGRALVSYTTVKSYSVDRCFFGIVTFVK